MTISVKINRDNQTISWISDAFKQDSSTEYLEPVVADVQRMSQELKERAMYHGLSARGTDAGAMGFGHWDGKDKPQRRATDAEKLARISRVVEHLNNPNVGWDWDLRPTSDPLANKSQVELEQLIKAAQAKLAGLGIG